MNEPAGLEQLTRWLESGEVDTVIAAFPDLYGRLMGKRFPAGYFAERVARGGLHACDYLLTCDMELEPQPGFAFSSWETGYGDMVLRPRLSTMRRLPWQEGSALVLCDLFDQAGQPVEESPRRILQRQVEECGRAGFTPLMASELEFYLLQGAASQIAAAGFVNLRPTTDYLIDYHILGTSPDEPLLGEIRRLMPLAGVPVECSKGEWGRGQHEVNLEYCEALEMADRHVVFKEGVKLLAARHNCTATFMAKLSEEMAGSSCHIHTSLRAADGSNAFWDERRSAPSEIFNRFLAGCLAQARHLSLFFAPNPNSYKRYRSASFAPVSIAWGSDNRTCGFRVVGSGQSLRIENRLPGADTNPYLAFAATLAAGLDGVRRGLACPEPVVGNAYADADIARVPRSLPEAFCALDAASLAQSAFGARVVEHLRHFVEREQSRLEDLVTDRERRRYLERI